MSIIKHRLLSIAFTLCIICIVDSLYIKFFIIVVSSIYHFYFMKFKVIYLFIFLLCFIYLNQNNANIMDKSVVRVDEIRKNYVIASNGKDKCILFNIDDVSLYDVIKIEGAFEAVYSNQNLGMFNYKQYLNRNDIYSSMYVKKYQILKQSSHIKARLYRHINRIEEKSIKQYLNQVFYRINDSEMDYSFYLYASGLHLSFIIYMISKMLKINHHGVGIAISFLFFMLFPSASYIIRIFFFHMVTFIFNEMNKRDQLGLSMIVLLIYDASFIFEISFIIPVCFRLIYLFDIQNIPKKIKQLLVLIPIQLYFFYECNLLSIILFPFLRIINSISFVIAFFSVFITGLYPLLKIIIYIQSSLLSLFELSYKLIGKPFFIWVVLWVLITILCISKASVKYLIMIACLLLFHMNMKLLTWFGEVTYIDIGQGDCILIREPMNGQVMLIDIANKVNKNLPKSIIYPILKSKGIKKIDKVLITHDDYDHSGGLEYLKELIQIDSVISIGQKINLKYLQFDFYQNTKLNDINDQSIVLFSRINKLNYMFMGDASKMIEKEIIDQYNKLDIDILKVAHHGSNTSSDISFIHKIRPFISVISSGKNNRYNHPNAAVISLLKNEGSYILDTQDNGSISIYFHPFFNVLVTGDYKISFLK